MLGKIKDAAGLINVSLPMAYRMAQRGELPGVVRFGKAVRVDLEILAEWLARQTARPNDEGAA